MIDRDLARPSADLKEIAVASPCLAVDALEQVVGNRDAVGLPAGIIVVDAEHLNACGNVAHQVALKDNVLAVAAEISRRIGYDGAVKG